MPATLETITPRDFTPGLFPGVDPATLDMEADKALIVRRVLETCGTEDTRLLFAHYTPAGVAAIAMELDELDPRSLSMVALLANIPEKKFKAYAPIPEPHTPPPRGKEAKSIKVRDFSSHLFWSVDRGRLDLEKSKHYVIGNVISHGSLEDWKRIRKRYTLQGVINVAKQLRYLSPRNLALMACLSGIPKEEFRCYKLRPSNPPHSP